MKIGKVEVLMGVICFGILAVAGISFSIGRATGGPSAMEIRQQVRLEMEEAREQEKQARDRRNAEAWAESAERLRNNGAEAEDLILCQSSSSSWVFLVCVPQRGAPALVNDGTGPRFWEDDTFGKVVKRDQNPELYSKLLDQLTQQVLSAQNGV